MPIFAAAKVLSHNQNSLPAYVNGRARAIYRFEFRIIINALKIYSANVGMLYQAEARLS